MTRGRDAACAAIFQQTIVQTSTPWPRGYFYHVMHGGSFQRWWRAGRGQGTEREPRSVLPRQVMRCKFQPRACIAARSFLLEGRSGSSLSSRTVLLASRSRNSQLPVPPCGGRTNPLRAGERDAESTPISESTGAFQSRPRVSTRLPFISKGEYVFLFRREQFLRKTGFRPQSPTPPAVAGWPCIPGGRKDGTPNRRISVRFHFCPGRSQRPLLLSVRIHHVLALVVKALSTPWYRLDQVFRRRPFGQPRQHRYAGEVERRTHLPVFIRRGVYVPCRTFA